jgi:hypothetical protein
VAGCLALPRQRSGNEQAEAELRRIEANEFTVTRRS